MKRQISVAIVSLLIAVFGCFCSRGATAQTGGAAQPPAQSEWKAADTGDPEYLGITIIALKNQTGDKDANHWSVSATSLVSSRLSFIGQLLVQDAPTEQDVADKIGPASKYKSAREWLCRYGEFVSTRRIVTGSYRREGAKWQISAHVLNVGKGTESGELTAISADWFDAAHDLALRIAGALGVEPTGAELTRVGQRWTTSPEAWELFSKTLADDKHSQKLTETNQTRLEHAVKLDPAFANARMLLAGELVNAGKLEAAEREAREALKTEEATAKAHTLLGFLAELKGQSADAEREFMEALRLEPKEVSFFPFLAETLTNQKRSQEAITLLSRAIRLFPADAEFHSALGLIYAVQGERVNAVKEAADAVRFSSDNMNLEFVLFQIYNMLGETTLAIQHGDILMKLAHEDNTRSDRLDTMVQQLIKLKDLHKPQYISAAPPKSYTEVSLKAALRARLSPDEMRSITDPFAASAALKDWAVTLTRGASAPMEKARALFVALSSRTAAGEVGMGQFSASEVYAAWGDAKRIFSCAELTRLYVALARSVGLQAYYVQVDRNNEDVITPSHACAALFCDGKAMLVDPEERWFGPVHKEFIILDDIQATAMETLMRFRPGGELKLCRTAVKLFPKSAWINARLGLILYSKSLDQEALAALDVAAKLKPDYWYVFMVRGRVYLQQENVDGALAQFRHSLALNPNFYETHYGLGLALLKLNMLKEAREEFTTCLQNSPSDDVAEGARHNIAWIDEQKR